MPSPQGGGGEGQIRLILLSFNIMLVDFAWNEAASKCMSFPCPSNALSLVSSTLVTCWQVAVLALLPVRGASGQTFTNKSWRSVQHKKGAGSDVT